MRPDPRPKASEARASLDGLTGLKRMLEVGRRFTPVDLSPADEDAYDLSGASSYSRATAVSMGLLIALVLLHALLAYVFHPVGLPPIAEMAEVWLILSAVALGTMLYQKLPTDFVARGINAFGAASMIITAWAVVTAALQADLECQRFAYGLIEILLIVVYMLFRFRPFYAGFTGMTLTALYLFTVKLEGVYEHDRLVQVAGYLCAMNMVGMVVAFLVERQERQIFQTVKDVERERARADGILRNILPEAISDKLKGDQGDEDDVVAEAHAEVTILHADLVGFTALAAELPPAELVAVLDTLFSEFDRIMARHDVEKVKTEGDAYIAAAGVPLPMHHHALRAAAAALDMVEAVRAFADKRGIALGVRIGIDTGAVVAGVIGKQKPVYDLWGAPVAGAARIEPAAEPGTVLVSAATGERLEGYLPLVPGPALRLESGREIRTFALSSRAAAAPPRAA